MTAIAIWCNHEIEHYPGLWIAADSRVSSSGSKLIDDAQKVFSLPITCKSPNADGFFTEVYHHHSYGYCFAGDTLLGQNAYLSLVPLLSNLVSTKRYTPSLADVARYVMSYLSRTFDACKAIREKRSMFEVALFGHCKVTNYLSAYHFMTRGQNDVSVHCEPHENMKEKDFLYLGDDDKKEQISSQIRAAFEAASAGRRLHRAPRYVIQDHIEDENSPSIGGGLQLGIADKLGFRTFPTCRPSASGLAIITYLGRDLAPDLQYVGGPFGALVASEAMA